MVRKTDKYHVWVHYRSGVDYWESFKEFLKADMFRKSMERQKEVSFVRIKTKEELNQMGVKG